MSKQEMESFEATYPRYPFAPLVHLAIALGEWIRKAQSRTSDRAHGGEVGEAA